MRQTDDVTCPAHSGGGGHPQSRRYCYISFQEWHLSASGHWHQGGGGSVCKYYIQEYFNHPEEREMVLCSIGGQCICGILGLTISNTNSPSSLCLDPISQYPCLWFLCRCLWYYFIFFFSSKKRLLSFMHSSEVFKIMKNWLEAKNIIFSLTAS